MLVMQEPPIRTDRTASNEFTDRSISRETTDRTRRSAEKSAHLLFAPLAERRFSQARESIECRKQSEGKRLDRLLFSITLQLMK